MLHKIFLSQCICRKELWHVWWAFPRFWQPVSKLDFFLSTLTSLTCGGQRERDITQSHYIRLSLICDINSNAKFRRFWFFQFFNTFAHFSLPNPHGDRIVPCRLWYQLIFFFLCIDCRLKIINYLIHIWPWIQIFLSYLVLIRCILGLSLKMLAVVILLMKPPLNRGQVIARTGQWIRNSLFTSLRSSDCRSNSPNSHLSQT